MTDYQHLILEEEEKTEVFSLQEESVFCFCTLGCLHFQPEWEGGQEPVASSQWSFASKHTPRLLFQVVSSKHTI